MSIEIPSGQQQRGCSLWWVVALALLVAGVGLLLALRPWEEAAVVARVAPLPTPVPGWESYRGAPAAAGTLTAAGREATTAAPQAATVVVVPQVVIEPVVTVPQVATQPVVLPPIESPICPQCALDPVFAGPYATWYCETMASYDDYTAWHQAWMAPCGGRPPGRPQPTMVDAAWQPGAGPAQGMRPGPMPGQGCGAQLGRPGQPWVYIR
jgi:hypothetical protein